MNTLFLTSSLILIILMVMMVYRIITGPTVIDRIVAVNVIGTKSIVILILIGILFNRIDMFVDIAIGYGLLNFIASIAAAKYFKRHKKIKQSPKKQGNKDRITYVN
jgi:multicomponent Na+:H+ antiporter subunit F